MKKIILITLIGILFSCGPQNNEGFFKKETITTEFVVTDIIKAKYSKVEGYIVYDDIKVHIDNGNSGYYYKDYNLKEGQSIEITIDIHYYSSGSGYELVFDDVDVSMFEI